MWTRQGRTTRVLLAGLLTRPSRPTSGNQLSTPTERATLTLWWVATSTVSTCSATTLTPRAAVTSRSISKSIPTLSSTDSRKAPDNLSSPGSPFLSTVPSPPTQRSRLWLTASATPSCQQTVQGPSRRRWVSTRPLESRSTHPSLRRSHLLPPNVKSLPRRKQRSITRRQLRKMALLPNRRRDRSTRMSTSPLMKTRTSAKLMRKRPLVSSKKPLQMRTSILRIKSLNNISTKSTCPCASSQRVSRWTTRSWTRDPISLHQLAGSSASDLQAEPPSDRSSSTTC